MKSVLFYLSVVSFASGVAFQFVQPLSYEVVLFLLVLVLLCVGSVVFVSQKIRVVIYAGAVIASIFLLGVVRTSLYENTYAFDPVRYVSSGTQGLTGVVVGEPDVRETNTRYVVDVDFISNEPIRETVRLIFTAPFYPEYEYGDEVVLVGNLNTPENFITDTGREFDYINYLKKDHIYFVMYQPETRVVSRGNGNAIKRVLFSVKKSFLKKIALLLPEPQASLAGGVLLGAKESMGVEWLDKFRETGLVHIVVLSGYNVTIVVDTLLKSLSFLPILFRSIVGVAGIILFAIITGAGATVVRASLMAGLVVFGRLFGREVEVIRLLFLAGLMMVFHNPLILLYDVSFQLSFMATLGLVTLSPLVKEKLFFIPEKFQLREVVSATLATQLFILPMLVFQTGELSIVSVVVNALVLVVVPTTMLASFLAGVFAYASVVLAYPFSFSAHTLLSYIFYVVDIFSSFTFASISLPFISVSVLCGMYAVIGIILHKYHTRQK